MSTLQVSVPSRAQSTALRPGPEWTSFEQFRIAGSPGLETVAAGEIGTLRTKAGVFRLVRDEDFQSLIGLASDADRVRGGFGMLLRAAKVVRDNPDSESAVDLLLHLAAQYAAGTMGAQAEDRIEPRPPIPDDDEIITDPSELKKRASKR